MFPRRCAFSVCVHLRHHDGFLGVADRPDIDVETLLTLFWRCLILPEFGPVLGPPFQVSGDLAHLDRLAVNLARLSAKIAELESEQPPKKLEDMTGPELLASLPPREPWLRPMAWEELR